MDRLLGCQGGPEQVLDVVGAYDGFETDAKPTSSLHASECLYLALASLSRERDVENDNRLAVMTHRSGYGGSDRACTSTDK